MRLLTQMPGVASCEAPALVVSTTNCRAAVCDPIRAARSWEENPAAAKWAFASAADTSEAGSWFGGAAAVAS